MIVATDRFSAACTWDQVLPAVASVAATVLTVVTSRHAQRMGEARQAAAAG